MRAIFARLLVIAVIATAVGAVGVAGAQTPPSTAAAFSGPAPARGAIGLLVTARAVTVGELSTSLTSSGCAPGSLGLLTGGQWAIYVAGAPAIVNQGFPASLGASIPFFVRCSDSGSTPGGTPSATATPSPTAATGGLTIGWNQNQPRLQDLRVRRAISMLSDVPVRWTPDDPSSPVNAPQYATLDPVEATKLLQAAGYSAAQRLVLTVSAPRESAPTWAAAERLQANLQRPLSGGSTQFTGQYVVVTLVDSRSCVLSGVSASACDLRLEAVGP